MDLKLSFIWLMCDLSRRLLQCAVAISVTAALAMSPSLHAQLVTTFAGGGWGEGGAPTAAFMNEPYGIAASGAGDVYVADLIGNRIVKFSTNHVATIIIGNGAIGSYFDSDQHSLGHFLIDGPASVILDDTGDILLSDSGNNRILRITSGGLIQTVAGSGQAGFSGDGGLAQAASLNAPGSLAIDSSGNIYIADTGNNVIRIVKNSGLIYTVAGTTIRGFSGEGKPAYQAELNAPRGICFDKNGNLYIADTGNARIRKISSDSIIKTVAGNGTFGYFGDNGLATEASLYNPNGVQLDSSGNLYIVDTYANVVRMVSPEGTITTVAGNSIAGFSGDGHQAKDGQLNNPNGIALGSDGRLYIADSGNRRVRVVDTDGTISTAAGKGDVIYGDGGPATSADLQPVAVRYAASGDIFVAEPSDVRKISPDGIITTIAGTGIPGYSGDRGPAISAQLGMVSAIAIAADQTVYIADSRFNVIRKISTDGNIQTIAGTGSAGFSGDGGDALSAKLNKPMGVAVDNNGNVFVSDSLNSRIRVISKEGIISNYAGTNNSGYAGDGGPAKYTEISVPAGMSIDSQGNLYFADEYNNRVRKISSNGTISTIAGNGTYTGQSDGFLATDAVVPTPLDVNVDRFGNVFIDNGSISLVSPDGFISTISTGVHNYFGDGGYASNAGFGRTSGIAVDPGDNIYVVENASGRVRKISAPTALGHMVGGTVYGLGSGTVKLSLNSGAQTVTLTADGAYAFPTALAYDQSYSVSIEMQPSSVSSACRISNASGVVLLSNVLNVGISCGSQTLTVTPTAGIHGSISPAYPVSIGAGSTASFTLTPDPGYVARLQGTCGGTLSGLTYTTNAVSADCSVAVSFYTRPLPFQPSDTTLSASVASPAAGQAIDFLATVVGADPTGTVTVSDGMSTLCAVSLRETNGTNSALCTATLANATTHVLTASYSGDANNLASTSIPLTVSITAATAFNPDQFGLTGSWFDPTRPGQGLEIEIYPDSGGTGIGTLFAGWFTFDSFPSLSQRWYTLQGALTSGSATSELSIYQSTGGNFNASPSVMASSIGAATLVIADCSHATLNYTFSDGSGQYGSIPLTRLTAPTTCSTTGDSGAPGGDYFLSGAWFNAATGGQGLVLDVNPTQTTLFGAWYTFSPTGQSISGSASERWFTIQTNNYVPGSKIATGIPIYAATGGVFNDPAPVTTTAVGTADITFSSCNSMSMNYVFTSGEFAGLAGTIPMTPVGAVPAGCN